MLEICLIVRDTEHKLFTISQRRWRSDLNTVGKYLYGEKTTGTKGLLIVEKEACQDQSLGSEVRQIKLEIRQRTRSRQTPGDVSRLRVTIPKKLDTWPQEGNSKKQG